MRAQDIDSANLASTFQKTDMGANHAAMFAGKGVTDFIFGNRAVPA